MNKNPKRYKKLSRWIIWYEEKLDCKTSNNGNCLMFVDISTGNDLLKIEVIDDMLTFQSYFGVLIKDLSRGEYLIKSIKKEELIYS